MKAEIKNVKVTLGDREFEFTVEELQALRKAINDFLPKEKINNMRSNDTLINEDFKKHVGNYEDFHKKVNLPYDPNRIWCSLEKVGTIPLNSTSIIYNKPYEHIQ